MFSVVLSFMESHLYSRCLNPFQQLLMTFIRLRHNFPFDDIAYRFGVHTSTCSRLFATTISAMYRQLFHLVSWPDRDVLRRTLPMSFVKHSPHCTVIIDCFEIFIDRPVNMLARAQTYSSYKKHNTAKYLIGISPQGTIVFISTGWGGRASDKWITENSGILDNILPGDVILADRGFDLQDIVSTYCARISVPAFTKGQNQLSAIAVEQTRRLANVRIHVERVIGLARRKYHILQATQSISSIMPEEGSLSLLDKVVHVCCALCNLCESVVPFD